MTIRVVPEGSVFGEFTVLKEVERGVKKGGASYRRLQVRCSCGVVKEVRIDSLTSGTTVSCGHVHRQRASLAGRMGATHGMTGTRTYQVWAGMIQRCTNPKNKSYPRYGGRGILVHASWLTFDGFYGDMGDQPEGYTLERIDNCGDYAPDNVRWATYTEQARNTRRNRLVTVNGVTKCLSEWCEVFGVTMGKAKYWLRKGVNPFETGANNEKLSA